jgi:uncharacterized damage-inducible protein DinB
MTSEIERIEAQLQRSFEGGAWHGPSLLEALAGVTPEEAHAHPVTGAHSIWELVLHLGGTYRLVLRRLQGDDAQLTPSEDWPPVPAPTVAAWSDAIETVRELNERVRGAILAFRPDRLDEPLVAEPPYTAYVQFVGITQHDLYHAGQIAILKRALAPTHPSRP